MQRAAHNLTKTTGHTSSFNIKAGEDSTKHLQKTEVK